MNGNADSLCFLFQKLRCHLSADLPDLTLQLPDARLSCIGKDQFLQCFIAERKLFCQKTVLGKLLLYEVFFCNMQLLVCRIATDFYDLHTITQRRINVLQVICRRDKSNLRQIDRQFQIMILKMLILFTVKHFQHCGSSVSFIIPAHLINLIQQDQWIFHTCLLDRRNDPSGHCTYIRLSVSTDLCFIPDTAQTDPDIFFVHGACHTARNTRFTDTRRSDQT